MLLESSSLRDCQQMTMTMRLKREWILSPSASSSSVAPSRFPTLGYSSRVLTNT